MLSYKDCLRLIATRHVSEEDLVLRKLPQYVSNHRILELAMYYKLFEQRRFQVAAIVYLNYSWTKDVMLQALETYLRLKKPENQVIHNFMVSIALHLTRKDILNFEQLMFSVDPKYVSLSEAIVEDNNVRMLQEQPDARRQTIENATAQMYRNFLALPFDDKVLFTSYPRRYQYFIYQMHNGLFNPCFNTPTPKIIEVLVEFHNASITPIKKAMFTNLEVAITDSSSPKKGWANDATPLQIMKTWLLDSTAVHVVSSDPRILAQCVFHGWNKNILHTSFQTGFMNKWIDIAQLISLFQQINICGPSQYENQVCLQEAEQCFADSSDLFTCDVDIRNTYLNEKERGTAVVLFVIAAAVKVPLQCAASWKRCFSMWLSMLRGQYKSAWLVSKDCAKNKWVMSKTLVGELVMRMIQNAFVSNALQRYKEGHVNYFAYLEGQYTQLSASIQLQFEKPTPVTVAYYKPKSLRHCIDAIHRECEWVMDTTIEVI